MARKRPFFTEEEMAVDEGLGYPRAFAKLCTDANTFVQGPPFVFLPHALQPVESARAKEFNRMFPVVDPGANPTANPRSHINLLWKEMNHLGNAGFDPGLFRVDPYGNVLYFHADSASPLCWDIDHWFPCSRGGRTVLSNLKLLQWQVCKKKNNKLEFLIPWWDLQLGISVNQFLSIFASRNSDFRNRAFSFLFAEAGNEELNESQVVEGHKFPQDFMGKKRQLGLAPAALVLPQRYSDASSLKPLILKSRSLTLNSPSLDYYEGLGKRIHQSWSTISKENDDPNISVDENNPYVSIALARDSLREREEAKKKQREIRGLEDELSGLKQRNELDRLALQDLEAALISKRRRAEKCRRLAEAQGSYKAQLERMIRDAMHQSVLYKEQVRLNQAACNTLVARLEAQKAICDSSEKELCKKFKQRDELEKQIVPYCEEQVRKRSWTDDMLDEGGPDDSTRLSQSSRRKMRKALRKELRVFLEEEQREAGISFDGEFEMKNLVEYENSFKDGSTVDCKLKGPASEEGQGSHELVGEEEHMTQLGKRNVEKWLHMLLEKAEDGPSQGSSPRDNTVAAPGNQMEDIVRELNLVNQQKEMKFLRQKPSEDKQRCDLKSSKKASTVLSEKSNIGDLSKSACDESSRSLDAKVRWGFIRPDSPRPFGRFPSSPLIQGVRRGMDCIGKKPPVIGDNEDDGNN